MTLYKHGIFKGKMKPNGKPLHHFRRELYFSSRSVEVGYIFEFRPMECIKIVMTGAKEIGVRSLKLFTIPATLVRYFMRKNASTRVII